MVSPIAYRAHAEVLRTDQVRVRYNNFTFHFARTYRFQVFGTGCFRFCDWHKIYVVTIVNIGLTANILTHSVCGAMRLRNHISGTGKVYVLCQSMLEGAYCQLHKLAER